MNHRVPAVPALIAAIVFALPPLLALRQGTFEELSVQRTGATGLRACGPPVSAAA